MSNAKQYDVIVIGSGQAGTPLSSAFAKAGKKTALVESTHIGGCCVNEGCTPTKTMIASGRVAYLTRRGQDYGIHTSSDLSDNGNAVIVDMKKVRDRKRKIVESFRGGNESRLQKAGVEVYMGVGSFVNKNTIEVAMNDGTKTQLTAGTICINTGERPAPPSVPGIDSVPPELVLNSTTIMELDVVPGHLVVIGGGYIGLEFGQLFGRLGSLVTIVQRNSRLMPREDKDITAALLSIIREDGIEVIIEAEVERVSFDDNGILIDINVKDGITQTFPCSHILYAAGRIPNSDSLNLSAAGISTDGKGYITTNERLETNVPGVYALGDVKGGPAFTHISYDDFRILQANLITNVNNPSAPPLTTKNRIVPYCAYTDPQLAHVGLHEDEARKLYPNKNIKIAKMSMNYVARALETDESRGLMKAVVDGDSGEILGFSCLGIEGGEVMSMVQMAMMGGVKYQTLANAVWAHPALAESLNNIWGFLE